jgi:hypothetical protein
MTNKISKTVKKIVTEVKLQNNEAYVPSDPVHYKTGEYEKSHKKHEEHKENHYHKGAYVPNEPIHFKTETKVRKYKHVSEEAHHAEDQYDAWEAHNDNHHLGSHADEVSDKLKEKTKPFENPEEKHAVNLYTRDSSDTNHALISHHLRGEPIAKYLHKSIRRLDTATNHPIGHHVHLYSGLGFNPAEHLVGEHHIHLPAYTSMTHDKHVAFNFADDKSPGDRKTIHILHVHMRPEDKGLHVSHASEFSTEHETILPRRTTLKVHPEPEIIHLHNGRKLHIWHAHIHHQY